MYAAIIIILEKYPALLTKMLSFNPNDIKIPAIVKAELLHGAEKSLTYAHLMRMLYMYKGAAR